MEQWQVEQLLKSDSFGRVERVAGPEGSLLRRVAAGGRLPGSGLVARLLMRRERLALVRLAGLAGTPELKEVPEARRATSLDGSVPKEGTVLVRSWVAGAPLHLAEELPRDFFERLDELVCEVHERGVCHNDLHKEQNILVGEDGWPHLIDFQLASVHRGRGALFQSRVRDDLRHVQKHRKRYLRDGRGPAGASVEEAQGRGHGLRRGLVAAVWRRTAKPIYNWLTRRVLRTRDGELRRPSSGPWPSWTEARGPRPS